VIYKETEGVTFTVEGTNKVVISGRDKQRVGEIAYKVKMLKKPDAYKGKGIKYEGEKLRIKPGKKAAKTA
jgi:large subunit ribosomal protein L6